MRALLAALALVPGMAAADAPPPLWDAVMERCGPVLAAGSAKAGAAAMGGLSKAGVTGDGWSFVGSEQLEGLPGLDQPLTLQASGEFLPGGRVVHCLAFVFIGDGEVPPALLESLSAGARGWIGEGARERGGAFATLTKDAGAARREGWVAPGWPPPRMVTLTVAGPTVTLGLIVQEAAE